MNMDSESATNFVHSVQMMEIEEPYVEKEKVEPSFSSPTACGVPLKGHLTTAEDAGITLPERREVPEKSTLNQDIVLSEDITVVHDNVQCMTNSRSPVQNTLSRMIWMCSKEGNDGSNGTSNISVSNANLIEERNDTDHTFSGKELDISDQNVSLNGEQHSVSGEDSRNLSVSNGCDDLIKMEGTTQEGFCGLENGLTCGAVGGQAVSELEMDHNVAPTALPELKISRKLVEKKPVENGSANLASGREKRSAFKKCTEWFKILTGEMQAKCFCSMCGAFFSSSRDLKTHSLLHNVKKTEPVDDVEQSSTPPNVMAERLQYNEGKTYECQECNECFSSKSGLTRHQAKHSPLNRYSCELCDQTFPTEASLQAHVHTHSNTNEHYRQKITVLKTPVSRVRKFKCEHCEARFTQQWSLDQHMVIHKSLKPFFKCNECHESFRTLALLVKHQESHSYQKQYKCADCDERFSHQSNLYKHQLTHVERRKVECSECDAMFSERSELKIHLFSVHGTENMCVCSHCNKCFSKQATLKRHLLTHSEREAFKCKVCNETFAQKSTLTRHSVLHGGEQFYRFVCSVCDRKFSRRETLNDHVRTHTGEKPFMCEVCHEGFSQKSAMKRHQILHFKERRNGKKSISHVDVDTGATEDILLSLVYSDV